MKQHVDKPTHKAGHTLDVLITREVDSLYTGSLTVQDPNLLHYWKHHIYITIP